MTCPQCGYALAPLEKSCPRCAQAAENTKTMRFDSMKTHHLVQLEQCPRCRFLIFPGDTRCTSCGTAVDRVWQQPPAASAGRRPLADSPAVLVGIACVALFLGFVLLFTLLN